MKCCDSSLDRYYPKCIMCVWQPRQKHARLNAFANLVQVNGSVNMSNTTVALSVIQPCSPDSGAWKYAFWCSLMVNMTILVACVCFVYRMYGVGRTPSKAPPLSSLQSTRHDPAQVMHAMPPSRLLHTGSSVKSTPAIIQPRSHSKHLYVQTV